MKKTKKLEADLDPPGTRHTRPGTKAADSALANSRAAPTRRRSGGGSSATRPGATAAGRALGATKRKRPSSK